MNAYPNVRSAQSRPAFMASTPDGCRTGQHQSGSVFSDVRISRAMTCQSPPKTSRLATSMIVHSLTLIVSRIRNMGLKLKVMGNSSIQSWGLA